MGDINGKGVLAGSNQIIFDAPFTYDFLNPLNYPQQKQAAKDLITQSAHQKIESTHGSEDGCLMFAFPEIKPQENQGTNGDKR